MVVVYSCLQTVSRLLPSTCLSPHEEVKGREKVCRCWRPRWQTGQRKRRTLIRGKLTVFVMHTHFANFETFNVGKPGCILNGLNWCFSKKGDNFAAWKDKTFFDGKHTIKWCYIFYILMI